MSTIPMKTDSDIELEGLSGELPREGTSSHWVKKVGLLTGVMVIVAVVGAAVLLKPTSGSYANLTGLEQKAEVVVIEPSHPACSSVKENCFQTGCCQVSGHKCFLKYEGVAQCNETCTPGTKGFTSCNIVRTFSMPAVHSPGLSLYCFSVHTVNTGSPKKSHELELLKLQLKYGSSIFGCGGWDVFSDETVELAPGKSTTKVVDVHNEFHQLKRKSTGCWVNWGLFFQVWMKIREVGKWHDYGYTVKVDPDAVFLPARLVSWLSARDDTGRGVYYENCKNVEYGFFGNLEVMTSKAFSNLLANLEDCHRVFAPCANDGCDWKFGPWGEDVFAQRCMDRHLIDKVEAFDLTTDGACEADRPVDQRKNKKWHPEDCSKVLTPAMHPFKKPKDYFQCLGTIMNTNYAI